jgi:TIR domain-containing protein/pentapeptide repeat protein
MANPEHLAMLKTGVESWNNWAQNDLEEEIDLSGADFQNADLWGAHLFQANLRDANFRGANLSAANLNGADLTRADLRMARLQDVDLRGAGLSSAMLNEAVLHRADLTAAVLTESDLSGANIIYTNCSHSDFRKANLTRTHLIGTNLNGADLSNSTLIEATIGDVVFGDNDLSTVKGLETVHHSRPSTIGIDTVYRSKGSIPESFLRGCGVPDSFTTFMRSLAAHPIEFHSCFISYSNKDDGFATELHNKLQGHNVRCWKDSEDLKIGDRFQEEIERAIRIHDKLLVVLTENSVESSWVEREVQAAFEKEHRQKLTVLFPIRLDDAVMDCSRAWAVDIRRTRHIGDFRQWKDHDSFQKSLDRLLRDLRSHERKLV